MTAVSPSRRHGAPRTTQVVRRKWDDVIDWPFQFIILPVLVVAGFCLVLFLASKQGTRLAAVRTWLSGQHPCIGTSCARAVSAFPSGGVAADAGNIASAGVAIVAGGGGQSSLADMDPVQLSAEDQLKFDFRYWLAEGAKLVGSQSKECDAQYGLPLVERWRKGRVSWCTAEAGAAAAGSGAPGRFAAAVPSRRLGGTAGRPASGGANGTAHGGGAGTPVGAAEAVEGKRAGATSTIALYPQLDKTVHSMFAVSTNTVVNSSAFLGSLPGALPAAPRGSYAAGCSLGPSAPGPEYMQLEGVRRWVVDALETGAYDQVSAACAAPAAANASSAAAAQGHAAVLHPVLLLSRWDSTNAFRSMEEVVSAFLSLAVLDDRALMAQGLQVVIADGRPDGFYLDLWASLSRPYPLRLLAKSPWPQKTCLTRAIHNAFANTSILTSMSVAKRTTCRSPLVTAAALWLRHMLAPAIQSPLRSAYQVPLQTKGVTRKTVVWISRRNYEAQAQASLTAWQDQRRFSNEAEVVLELHREVWRWNDESCIRSGLPKSSGARRRRRAAQQRALLADLRSATGDQHRHQQGTWREEEEEEEFRAVAGAERAFGAARGGPGRGLRAAQRCRQSSVIFELRVVELSDMPFYPDQLQVLGQASILAGAHGAGLANMMWMAPGKGGVLELHHNSAGNEHYHNQAHLLGHKYVSVESDGKEADLQEVAAGLRKLLDALGAA